MWWGGRGVEVAKNFFFQAEDGVRGLVRSRGLGDVYKEQGVGRVVIDLIGLLGADDADVIGDLLKIG